MKVQKSRILPVFLILAVGISAQAHEQHYGVTTAAPTTQYMMSSGNAESKKAQDVVNARQKYQHQRLEGGIKDKTMNVNEEYRIRQSQKKLREMEKEFNSDGVLSASEAKKLQKAQDKLSETIYRAKHNKWDRKTVDERVDRQANRIEKGIASGALTAEEQEKVNKRQEKIKEFLEQARSDGKKLSKMEKEALRKMQNRASKQIHRLKHNDERGPASETEVPAEVAAEADAAVPSAVAAEIQDDGEGQR